MKKIPEKYCYVVFCNKQPLVYAVYERKQPAVRYALNLIRWRREHARERELEFGYYHFNPYIHYYNTIEVQKKSRWDNLWADNCVFTACLKIKDGMEDHMTDDGCVVRVIRYPLRKDYKIE